MDRYSILSLANLDAHPSTLTGFRKWLSRAIKAVEHWQENEAGIDELDFDFCAGVVNRASKVARRLGAGHLAVPTVKHSTHSRALDLLGRMLAWAIAQVADPIDESRPLTMQQAAQRLNIGLRTMHSLVDDGVIPHQRIGKGRGTKRVRPDDLLAYEQQTVTAGGKKSCLITLEHLRAV